MRDPVPAYRFRDNGNRGFIEVSEMTRIPTWWPKEKTRRSGLGLHEMHKKRTWGPPIEYIGQATKLSTTPQATECDKSGRNQE